MTAKTDLTENREFSGGNWRSRFIPIDSSIRINELIDSNLMSSEEYSKMIAYEGVFGRKRHFTDAIEVFRKSEHDWMMDMKCHCQRCGKLFRIPWKKRYDLCLECDEIVESQMKTSIKGGPFRTPWKEEVYTSQKDILNLR